MAQVESRPVKRVSIGESMAATAAPEELSDMTWLNLVPSEVSKSLQF
jgi:hypothetical protein